MQINQAIKLLREDIALYETDFCKPGDGTPDGELMEALQMGTAALEKQVPKKPIIVDGGLLSSYAGYKYFFCPRCRAEVDEDKNCMVCGQRIDWSEDNG